MHHPPDTRRHDPFFDKHSFNLPVVVIGVGGIGGYIVMHLVNLGVGQNSTISVHDGDKIERHNLVNQVYGLRGEYYVSWKKVNALDDLVRQWSNGTISDNFLVYPSRVEGALPLRGIVFLCVDSMTTRRDILERCIFRNEDIRVVFETRMSANYCVINIFDPNNERHVTAWYQTWFPDEQAPPDFVGCGTHHAIGTTANAAASLAVSAFINIAAYLKYPDRQYLVPNQIEYNFKTFIAYRRVWE